MGGGGKEVMLSCVFGADGSLLSSDTLSIPSNWLASTGFPLIDFDGDDGDLRCLWVNSQRVGKHAARKLEDGQANTTNTISCLARQAVLGSPAKGSTWDLEHRPKKNRFAWNIGFLEELMNVGLMKRRENWIFGI